MAAKDGRKSEKKQSKKREKGQNEKGVDLRTTIGKEAENVLGRVQEQHRKSIENSSDAQIATILSKRIKRL